MPLNWLIHRFHLAGAVGRWDHRSTELLCGLAALGWAAMVGCFDGYHSNPAYAVFLTLAPAWVWASAMGLTGAAQVAACFLLRPWLTRLSGLGGAFVWSFTVFAMIHVSPRLASLPIYVLLGLACLWLHVKA